MMSQKRSLAPWRAKAVAVDVKVNDGTITTSPGSMSSSMADISSASVHDVVSSTSTASCQSRRMSCARALNSPLLAAWPDAMAFSMLAISWPTSPGRLKGMGSDMRSLEYDTDDRRPDNGSGLVERP